MWWRALVLALVFVACTAQPAAAPAPSPVVITPADGTATNLLIILHAKARDRMAHDWVRYYADPYVVEHAYCLSRYAMVKGPGNETLVIVDSVSAAATDSADPNDVEYRCGLVPAIHTHPPSNCDREPWGTWYCTPLPHGDERFCAPSSTDIHTAARNLQRFDLLQCGEWRFVVYTGGVSTH